MSQEVPICEHCGNPMAKEASYPIYPPDGAPESEFYKRLPDGYIRMKPTGYEDIYRCTPCIPPRVTIQRSV